MKKQQHFDGKQTSDETSLKVHSFSNFAWPDDGDEEKKTKKKKSLMATDNLDHERKAKIYI